MKVIEVMAPDGRVVYLEVDDQAVARVNPAPPGGGVQAGTGEMGLAMVREIEKLGDVIANVCGTVRKQVTETLKAAVPAELTLEFGVTLAGEAGIPLVTKGTAEGTLKVTATWKFDGQVVDPTTTAG